MTEFKLEYTEPDKVYETVDTIKDNPPYRYYEIEVSRKQVAYVNVRVPYDTKLDLSNSYTIAVEAIDELVRDYDWEISGDENFDVEHIKEVSADEAANYDIYEA